MFCHIGNSHEVKSTDLKQNNNTNNSQTAVFFMPEKGGKRGKQMRTKALIRLLVMAVLTVNAGLTLAGVNPIPFDESAFTEVATQIAAGLSIVWSWWKDAPMTAEACEGTGYTRLLKLQKNGANGENFEADVEDWKEGGDYNA